MRDSLQGGQGDRVGTGLTGLARTVVARLVARDGGAGRPADPATVAALARALLDPDPAGLWALRHDLRRARIGDVELADLYFPAVARHMGCAWVADSAPFTDVTIAVARMQALLRDIGRDWTSNAAAGPASAAVLIVLPEGEQHSFGAVILAGQLRRQGISVRLEVGSPGAGLRRLVQERVYDCAMISVACEEKLDQCKRLVDALRQGSGGRLWIAIGGPLLDRPIDIRGRTGADVATCDPFLVLEGGLARRTKVKEMTG